MPRVDCHLDTEDRLVRTSLYGMAERGYMKMHMDSSSVSAVTLIPRIIYVTYDLLRLLLSL